MVQEKCHHLSQGKLRGISIRLNCILTALDSFAALLLELAHFSA
jgi:hypothetical protein